MTLDDHQQALSVPQTARLLGVSAKTVQREMRRGNVPYRKLGNRCLIPLAWVREMLGDPVLERKTSAAEALAVLQEVATTNAEWQRILRELGELPIPRWRSTGAYATFVRHDRLWEKPLA